MNPDTSQSRWRHLRENRMTYGEHFWRSLGISLRMLQGGLASLVHAVIPDLFTTSASDAVKELHNELFRGQTLPPCPLAHTPT